MVVIAVDTGNRYIKTAHAEPFSAGLNMLGDTPPIVNTDTLFYNGNYYTFAETQGYHRQDKTVDDYYFILTLAAIAREIVMKDAIMKSPVGSNVDFKQAMKEAKLFGEVVEVASSADANYTFIPKDYEVPADADYFHITTNNTIYGTELRQDLDSPVTLVADMSSDIFSRPIDVSKYGMIYGGAQKNLSMAGVTFVIVKDEILGKVSRPIPTMIDYRTHVDKGSMFNTPPVVPIFCALQTLKWIKAQGGVKEMERRAIERADLLYAEIDRNKMFRGTAAKEDRSLMNICFVMADEYKDLEADFLKFATERGMSGIKGHRSVGGFRASCYNAMPLEGVQALVDCMKEFEANH